ncbi:hypothetical protein H632_c434p0 [Helicosporidium sp. ATCC 50920]|nr:hypothetical protein H632_c434p0 [Helicosporidium sp. ATCC 50920]|eukprot:KDD75924.1 hypothetical protein H632_c434p0 [Helicosporidium sp. ATCC 50920]
MGMPGLVGGYTPNANGERAQQAAEFATEQLEEQNGVSDITVRSIDSQVVAGTNYRITLDANLPEVASYTAVVFGACSGRFEASVMCDSDSVAEFVCRKVNEQSNSLYPLTVGPIESCEQNSEGACVITLVLHNESLNMKVKAEVTGEGQNMSLKDWKIISQG